MAGIGISLNKIFGKNTLSSSLYGFAYSAAVTISPMFLIIGNIMLMQYVLGFSKTGYILRELFSCTILYIFIFALLCAAPFNAVLSRYLSDTIFEERYEDIMPCYYLGLLLNLIPSVILGVLFCLHEYYVGGVALYYVCTGFLGFISLVIVFYSMLYLSICKDYKKISWYYLLGMAAAFLLSLVFVWVFSMEVTYSMLLALTIGFFLTGCMEYAKIRGYFQKNSNRYRLVFIYFGRYWELIFTNFFYTLGLYVHNFVFWTTDMKMVVADSFVCAQPYDMASCLAMFTNISATIIFIARVEMHFSDRYRKYSEAVIGGRGSDIELAKKRMFTQLDTELMNLVRIQFCISVVIFLICVIFLPGLGFSGLTMRIYPCLAAGYFILFLMYAEILFLYYYNDLNGALITSIIFCGVTFLVSMAAREFPDYWYGVGVVAGSFAGFTSAYGRLRWVKKHLDTHIFCRGTLLKKGTGKKPSGKVYDVYGTLRRQKRTAAKKKV
ncbi:MAG: exopolysaccharide Pel transporter PelG [Lachnospiraceae bacterium]|nr:exopolysaccharide Pel transporter PelG [Lachnospiraceae bacterium]